MKNIFDSVLIEFSELKIFLIRFRLKTKIKSELKTKLKIVLFQFLIWYFNSVFDRIKNQNQIKTKLKPN